VPRNIEIKARLGAGVEALLPRARAVAGGAEPVLIEQDDSFYAVPHGRLKLRRFADGSAELIHYTRADDSLAAKASDYVRVAVPDAAALHEALQRANGLVGRVVKQRWLLLAGATRIHLDRVEGLGDFIELEVVLREGQRDDEGRTIAEALMHELGLADAPRIAGAYRDLLHDSDGADPQPDAASSSRGISSARKS
jgi:adenylate cyclase class IV